MNRDEFRSISSEVIADIIEDMEKEGLSANSAVITTLTLTLFSSKLSERLFEKSDSLEIEREH